MTVSDDTVLHRLEETAAMHERLANMLVMKKLIEEVVGEAIVADSDWMWNFSTDIADKLYAQGFRKRDAA